MSGVLSTRCVTVEAITTVRVAPADRSAPYTLVVARDGDRLCLATVDRAVGLDKLPDPGDEVELIELADGRLVVRSAGAGGGSA